MYIRRIVLLPTKVCMIQVVDLLADHLLIEAWSVSPSSNPWWRCRWKPYWMQLGLLPCADVSFIFRKVRVANENDKGLLGNRPVAPWPDKYVSLDLTWSNVETSAGARLESWGVSGWYKRIRMVRTHQDDASDETSRPLGSEAKVEMEVEIDVGVWGT